MITWFGTFFPAGRADGVMWDERGGLLARWEVRENAEDFELFNILKREGVGALSDPAWFQSGFFFCVVCWGLLNRTTGSAVGCEVDLSIWLEQLPSQDSINFYAWSGASRAVLMTAWTSVEIPLVCLVEYMIFEKILSGLNGVRVEEWEEIYAREWMWSNKL